MAHFLLRHLLQSDEVQVELETLNIEVLGPSTLSQDVVAGEESHILPSHVLEHIIHLLNKLHLEDLDSSNGVLL